MALLCHFLVIDNSNWFWMGSYSINIQLMLSLLNALYLGTCFSYSTSMTFFIMLFVTLLSKLMILLSILNVTRLLICGNSYNWSLNLNLTYKALQTVLGLLIFNFNAGKTQIVSFDNENNCGATESLM